MHLSLVSALQRCASKTLSKQTLKNRFNCKDAGLGLAIAIVITNVVTPAWANQPRLENVSPPPQTRAAVFQLLFVDPVSGNDRSDGSQRSPLRSITRAVQLAQPNTVILLAAGTYSSQTGERFPITLPPDVSLQENPVSEVRGVTIQGEVIGGQLPSTVSSHSSGDRTAANRALGASTPSGSSFSVLTGDYPPGTVAPRSQFRAASRPTAGASDSGFANTRPETALPNTVVVPASPFGARDSAARAVSPPPTPVRGVPISVRPPTLAPTVISPEQTVEPPTQQSLVAPSRRVTSRRPAATGAGSPPAFSQVRSPAPLTDSPSQSSAGISIPVPPPASSTRYRAPGGLNTSQGGMVAPSSTTMQPILNFQESIEIPVPAPARRSTGELQPSSRRRGERASRTAAPPSRSPRYDLLPVPDPNVPLGNIGDLATVTVSGAGTVRRSPPTTPVASRAAELGLRYRVVVNTRDRSVQERVLQLFPNAFLTYDDDEDVVMQVGAFNERDNAEEVATLLDQNGIRAKVERVD